MIQESREERFIDWLMHDSPVTLCEVDIDNRRQPEWIDIEDVELTERADLIMVLREAQHAGYKPGSYNRERYGGSLSLYRSYD